MPGSNWRAIEVRNARRSTQASQASHPSARAYCLLIDATLVVLLVPDVLVEPVLIVPDVGPFVLGHPAVGQRLRALGVDLGLLVLEPRALLAGDLSTLDAAVD